MRALLCEVSLLTGRAATASARALDFCNLMVLRPHTFSTLLKQHPEVKEVLTKTSEEQAPHAP